MGCSFLLSRRSDVIGKWGVRFNLRNNVWGYGLFNQHITISCWRCFYHALIQNYFIHIRLNNWFFCYTCFFKMILNLFHGRSLHMWNSLLYFIFFLCIYVTCIFYLFFYRNGNILKSIVLGSTRINNILSLSLYFLIRIEWWNLHSCSRSRINHILLINYSLRFTILLLKFIYILHWHGYERSFLTLSI